MAIVVQKYGGTSVESIEKMKQIANRIINRKNQGDDLVIVVSAMGKTTNYLTSIATQISSRPCTREMDVLLSTGEQVTISLLSMILKERGYPSISLTGYQAGISTSGTHTKNKINDVNTEKIKNHIDQGKIVIVAGFQGINESGDITTLGRGGSDTTAVALASKLRCRCEIYTDVTGIYSVDPRLYKHAKKLKEVSYEEMMEMSSLGANIMEPRSVEIASKFNIVVYVASSSDEEEGSYIKERINMIEEKSITGLTVNDDILMVTLVDVPYSSRTIATIFSNLAKNEVNVDMISQTSPQDEKVNISFTAPGDQVVLIEEALMEIKTIVGTLEIIIDRGCIKLSVVGIGMRNQSGIAAEIFRLFALHDINFKQVTTSEISISYTINNEDKERAVTLLADEFNL
ncbi:aspartate kinase [Haloplasma contractile]|uniref:Aspartokinase n=1 Tax=Haloplasma contractile SSD-17B TaxID=1033810 RepID=U2DVV4_9MOLU|nr:aspartate kinase [Haloplasma contractile]ERJ12477.1 Aspartokinase Amino acid transport protein [Haloplasma contractile SSD-17B]